MVLKNGTDMNTMTNTLSRMAMTVPLTIAAPVALSSDVASLADAAGTGLLPLGAQGYWGQAWRFAERIDLGGYRDPNSVDCSGAPCIDADSFHLFSSIGITPVFRPQIARRTAWLVEGGVDARRHFAAYDNSRRPTAFSFGGHAGAGYAAASGGEVAMPLPPLSTGGIRHGNKGMRFNMATANEASWSWTQTA